MDTSKEYIKMCEKAVEIQEQSTPIQDWDYNTDGENVYLGYKTVIVTGIDYETECLIWLPRQDQLQGMVKLSTCCFDALGDVYYKMKKNWKYYGFKFNSMEQLWLALVMKEKFKKIWDGTDWKETP